MASYTYKSNLDPNDRTDRLVLKHDQNGEPIEFLERGGAPKELSKSQYEAFSRIAVLEPATEEIMEAQRPDAVPEDYADLKADEVVELMRSSSASTVEAIKEYEKAGKGRKTILEFEPSDDDSDDQAAGEGAQDANDMPDTPAAQSGQPGIEVDLSNG